MNNNNIENKSLRVWWMPQIGTDATFYIPVETVEQGKKIIDLLSAYDCFECNNNIKGDYCNAGGLQMFDESEGEWVDWFYEDSECYYDDVNEYCEEKSTATKSLEEFSKALFEQVSFD